MTTRTPTQDHERPHSLRVLEGGLSCAARQEDEPAELLDALRLEAEIAAAARLCDELEQDGLRISFDRDPDGGRVRVRVMDDAGHAASELSLAQVVSPDHLRLMGAAS
ncbi:MAG: hypothetical protein PGN13_04920 [Patulibacter minatonensis]